MIPRCHCLVGPYVVIKVAIEQVDVVGLLALSRGPEFATAFQSLIASLYALGQADAALPGIMEKILKQVSSLTCDLIRLSCVVRYQTASDASSPRPSLCSWSKRGAFTSTLPFAG
jgi:hypothetical protein